jgi:2-keto-4-pentenoate hydratase
MSADHRDVELIELLERARERGEPVVVDPGLVPTLADGYRVQAEFAARRVRRGEHPAGWKVGLTDAGSRRRFGVTAPVRGPLFEEDRVDAGDTLSLGSLCAPRVEVELAVRIGVPIQGLVEPDDVREALDAVSVAIELADSRVAGWPSSGSLLVADQAGQGRWVIAEPMAPPAGLDTAALVAAVSCDGVEVGRGGSASVLGDPLRSVAWLAGDLGREGRGLGRGEWVLTGTLTPMRELAAGRWVARIDGLGELILDVEP